MRMTVVALPAAWRWLLAGVAATSLPILAIHLPPVVSGEAQGAHSGHFDAVGLHAFGGTLMLVAGALALYIGRTRRWFAWHRHVGATYLLSGAFASVVALGLSVDLPHTPRSLGVATAMIALVWLAFAAFAWRAARNRRFDTHREWMIRSYVVTWTFVFCRIAMQFKPFPALGAEGVTATIWLTFIVPVVACELALQWPRASRLGSGS
jgi:hypothetical protein